MNITTIATLLQTAMMLLTAARTSTTMSTASMISVINFGQSAVQTAAQAEANIPFPVTPNNSIYPNANGLSNAAYRDASGNWTRLGATVILSGQDTSYGDLNRDGKDDAAVVVNKPNASGPHYFLEALLNQGNVMFDIAELPLGTTDTITSHRIASGTIMIDGKNYILFGDALETQ